MPACKDLARRRLGHYKASRCCHANRADIHQPAVCEQSSNPLEQSGKGHTTAGTEYCKAAQVKELAAQVLPVELVALSSEPARPSDEALPPAETHQVGAVSKPHSCMAHCDRMPLTDVPEKGWHRSATLSRACWSRLHCSLCTFAALSGHSWCIKVIAILQQKVAVEPGQTELPIQTRSFCHAL